MLQWNMSVFIHKNRFNHILGSLSWTVVAVAMSCIYGFTTMRPRKQLFVASHENCLKELQLVMFKFY